MINFAKIWDILITKFPAFMEGVEITLQLAFFTVLFGSLLGLVVAVCRRTRLLPLRWLMNAYVAFIRGTPLLVQVLLVVYGLPQLGIRFPRMTLCIIALVINSGRLYGGADPGGPAIRGKGTGGGGGIPGHVLGTNPCCTSFFPGGEGDPAGHGQ